MSMTAYTTVKSASSFEYEDRKSVFIAAACPVSTEAEALAFIESVKKRYPDARHHVYAYVLRENSIMRFTDDREPQGTAGVPVLDVIRKRGCTDTVIVVTRYFGGTLLGTGGLVKAYTSAAAGALEAAEVIRYDIYSELYVKVSYSDYGKITSALSQYGFRTSDVSFRESVELYGSLVKLDTDKLLHALTEVTSGRAECKILCEKFDY